MVPQSGFFSWLGFAGTLIKPLQLCRSVDCEFWGANRLRGKLLGVPRVRTPCLVFLFLWAIAVPTGSRPHRALSGLRFDRTEDQISGEAGQIASGLAA